MSVPLELPGCRLVWREVGGGVPILFIHGTGASAWGDLPARTAAFARAITYDRRGFGESHARPVADLRRHEDDAIALLAARDAGAAIVVGWSIGGVVAIGIAVRRPDLVRALVLLEPPLWAKRHPDLDLFSGVVVSILTGYLTGPVRGGRRFIRWVSRERDGANSLDKVSPEVRHQIDGNAAAVGVEIRAGTGEHLSSTDLAKITAPTMVIIGDRSQPFFEASARRLTGTVPGARLERLAGASHFLQLERSEAIAQLIRDTMEHTRAA